jgi:hypothetical protein
MADEQKPSGLSEIKKFANWAYEKASSHPIGQIEETLKTGKPAARPETKPLVPKKSAAPAMDLHKAVQERNQARREAYDKKYGKPSGPR